MCYRNDHLFFFYEYRAINYFSSTPFSMATFNINQHLSRGYKNAWHYFTVTVALSPTVPARWHQHHQVYL